MKSARSLIAKLFFVLAFCQPAAAFAGEDFPFFCAVNESHLAFKVSNDLDSPTGYSMVIYRMRWFEARLPVDLSVTDDGRYWLVKGVDAGPLGAIGVEVLAYIGFEGDRTSHGDIKLTMGQAMNREWDLKPLTCRRL